MHYFCTVDNYIQVKIHIMHCSFSNGEIVSRTRHNVKLYADCVSSRDIAGAADQFLGHKQQFKNKRRQHVFYLLPNVSPYIFFSSFLFNDPYSDLNTYTPKCNEIFFLPLQIYTVANVCETIVAVFLYVPPTISTLCS